MAVIKKIFSLILPLLLNLAPGYGIDLSYQGEDCTITYRFTPKTGTLNDLIVIYNDRFTFYPSFYGGITTFSLAGKELHPWEGRHAVILLEEHTAEGVYQAKFKWAYRAKSFDFTLKMRLNGKTLVVEYSVDPLNGNVVEFGCDRSEKTLGPKIIQLPYGHSVLFFRGIFVSGTIDPLVSNASTIFPQAEYYSAQSALYGWTASYHKLTDGSRNPLHERIHISVSPEIADTFYQPANPVSPFRSFLVDKVIVDLWREKFEHYKEDLQTLANLGMTDLFVLIHAWQKYGYDNGLPTTYPAGDSFGGESSLLGLIDLCEANDYLFALHTNYVDFYENSDVWNGADTALDSDGSRVKAWYNSFTGTQSYLMKPSRTLYYAGLYEPLIHETYRTRSSFLDVHSSVLPSAKVDYDAGVDDSGKQEATFRYYRDLLAYARSTHAGPVVGEGFGNSTHIWAGYVDGLEADPRSRFDEGGTDVPLIVDYKLRVLHGLFVPHGAGYLERFYLDKWDGYTVRELDRYRVTEIAFGNAGFIHNPLAKGIALEEVSKDYCFLKHLQRYYLSESPLEILYRLGDDLLTLADALRRILPATPAKDLEKTLNKELCLLKITYPDGFTLYVNRSTAKYWDVVKNSVLYRLPPNGFLAFKASDFLAYMAEVHGKKSYYIHPRETNGCQGIYPPFNLTGQKVVNRSLFQTEYINWLTWQTDQDNTDILRYRLYQVEGEDWQLLAELAANAFEYRHRGLEKDRQYTYALEVVDVENRPGDPVFLSLR